MFLAQKSFNGVSVFIAFILAVAAAVMTQKPADEAKKLTKEPSEDKTAKRIIKINIIAIVAAVLSGVLLLLAFGVFHFNTRKLYLAKGILGLAVMFAGIFLTGFGFLYEDNKADFVKIAIAAGIFIAIAGSFSAALALQVGMPK